MKKFSGLTNQKFVKEPKIETKLNESDVLKNQILDLMDRCLRIQSYGSVDNRFLSGSVKIIGKEMLVEAMLEIINDKSKKDKVVVLESLKNKIKDWESIDSEISFITKDNKPNKEYNEFSKTFERYDGDIDSIVIALESKLNGKSKSVIDRYKKDISDYNFISDFDKDKIFKSKIFNV
jgi:hypothetical protein